MPQWKEIWSRYAYLLWRGSLALFAAICIILLAVIGFSGGSETEDAFDSGRRLLIALDTGEVSGKIMTLDGKVVKKPAEAPPPAEAPVPDASAPETAPAPTETPPPETPAEPPPEAARPPATPMPDTNPALTEQTEEGVLPVIGSDGTKPWRYYSKPFERTRNQPMVAIVVTGLGESRTTTQEALNLHEYVTLSFSPYARDLETWGSAIRATGHELLIDLPLEPTNYPATDPGPDALLLEKGPNESERRLKMIMARYQAFAGVMTPQNESFTANDDAFRLLLQTMANRGLLLVMGSQPHKKETRDIIDTSHTALLVADVLIDEELTSTAIQARLTQLAERAKNYGYAVGVAQAYPLTLKELRAWIAALEAKGVMLVPVTAIAKLRFS